MKKNLLATLVLSSFFGFSITACQPPETNNNVSQNTNEVMPQKDGVINISVNDSQCNPMQLTIPSGKTEFNIKNDSGRKLEWEILKGVMVVDERENIAPSLSSKMTVTLLPGEYEMTCGLLTNPRGKLVVTDSGFKAEPILADMEKLAQPLADYKTYVVQEVNQLVKKVDAFNNFIANNDVDNAKKIFADTRSHYERIEPIAELFGELDPVIDSREDDYKNGINDNEFTGFHRIEYDLWISNKINDNTIKLSQQLVQDVNKLKAEIEALNFPPNKVVGGAAALIEEVAGSKITGEEDRYSRTDLADFKANIEGAEKIVDLFNTNIKEKDPKLLEVITNDFKKVNTILDKYKLSDGSFESYDKLTETDRNNLQTPINSLAEELAKLRGTLGLN